MFFLNESIRYGVNLIKNILNIHVSLALTTTILYVALVVMGRKILKGDYGILKLHKKLGILALIMRTLTFVTSFYAVIE